MERTLEINVISATGIKNVNLISKMDVYAVISIVEDYNKKKQKARTPVDRDGGTNPTWNYPLRFAIQEPLVQQNRLNLVFKLKCDRVLGDKDIGEVSVPVKELFEEFFSAGKEGEGKSEQRRAMRFLRYQVREPSGKAKGELNFSYRVTEVSSSTHQEHHQKVGQPITGYPAPVARPSPSAPPYPYYQPPPPAEHNYGYQPPSPPPQAYSGYPPPPPPVYGYPPPSPYGYPPVGGYGYPPPPVQQPPPQQKNKFGMGLGAGLLGAVVGGLLLGDLVSDGFDF